MELGSSRRVSIRLRRELQKRLSEEGLNRGEEEEAMNKLVALWFRWVGDGVSTEAAIRENRGKVTASFWDFGGACDSGLDLIFYI